VDYILIAKQKSFNTSRHLIEVITENPLVFWNWIACVIQKNVTKNSLEENTSIVSVKKNNFIPPAHNKHLILCVMKLLVNLQHSLLNTHKQLYNNHTVLYANHQ